MSAVENAGPFSIAAGAALERNLLVKLSGVTAVVAVAGDTFPTLIGRTNDKAASGAQVGVTPLTRGLMRLTAGAAIAAGAAVYPMAGGKIDDTAASGSIIGYAMQAATADGDEIDVLITT